MFRKKEKQYYKNPDKIQAIVENRISLQQIPKNIPNEKLHQKYQAYTLIKDSEKDKTININFSQIKAESYLRKCNFIDSADVVFKAVELLQENNRSFFQEKNKNKVIDSISPSVASVKCRFKQQISQRKQYKKLISQIQDQMTVLSDVNMRATDIFIYKQQILSVYFERLLSQLGKECKQKALSIQIIWNSMIDLMQRVLKILLTKIKEQQDKQLNGFMSVHQEINDTIMKVTQTTQLLQQKLSLKDQIIKSYQKKIQEENIKSKEKQQDKNYDQFRNFSYQVPVVTKQSSTQTYQRKQPQPPKKIFDSIGINVKQSKFQKTVSTQSMKQFMFDIGCVNLLIISQKPKKTPIQERQTTKTTQTQQKQCIDFGIQSDPIQRASENSKIRISTESYRKPSMILDRYSMNEKIEKHKSSDRFYDSNIIVESQKDHPQQKRATKRQSKKFKLRQSKISPQNKQIKTIMKTLEDQKQQDLDDMDTYVDIAPRMIKTSNPSGFNKSLRNTKSTTSHSNSTNWGNLNIDNKPSIRKSVISQWRKQRNKSKPSLSAHNLNNISRQISTQFGFDQQINLKQFNLKKRDGFMKTLKSLDQQIQCIIQCNVQLPEDNTYKQSTSFVRDSIYSSYNKKLSSFRRPVNLQKNIGICKIISEVYQMAYQKIIKSRGIEFVDTIFDYFTISYGAHNKNFVIDKVSMFLMEAKQLQSSNIHIELFCLLAKLSKYPQTDDLLAQDFELCVKLLIELNCDKNGFHIETNFTTVDKLKQISQPLLTKCVGPSKAVQITRTMQTLITRSIEAKDSQDIYRISVSSTILFMLNRIAKERSWYHIQLYKLVKMFRLPGTQNIQTKTLEIFLKYLNINKKLYIQSCIRFKNDIKIKSTLRIPNFITHLMRVDYPLPENTRKHFSQKYNLQLKTFENKQQHIEYLNQMTISTLPVMSQHVMQNLIQQNSQQQLLCLQQILSFCKLQDTSTSVFGVLVGRQMQYMFCSGLEQLINEKNPEKNQ